MSEKIEKVTIPSYEIEQNTGVLAAILRELVPPSKSVHILCVGTDRSTGDSLGPLTGTFLRNHFSFPHSIHGDLNNPITASNLGEIISKIPKNDFVIAIDSALGKLEHVGCIQVKRSPLEPGTGVYKSLPKCGNISILGVVNVSGYMEYLVLHNTRLATVWNMAWYIADQLNKALGITAYQQAAISQTDSLDCKV